MTKPTWGGIKGVADLPRKRSTLNKTTNEKKIWNEDHEKKKRKKKNEKGGVQRFRERVKKQFLGRDVERRYGKQQGKGECHSLPGKKKSRGEKKE